MILLRETVIPYVFIAVDIVVKSATFCLNVINPYLGQHLGIPLSN
jgi:hypothetical protein